jgi:replication fork clamp-binding protein CrfC
MTSEEDQRRLIERVEAEIMRVEEQVANASAKIEEHGGPLAGNAAVVYWIKEKEQLRKEKEQLRKEKELLLELQLENAKGKSSKIVDVFDSQTSF